MMRQKIITEKLYTIKLNVIDIINKRIKGE